jgi:hypothetical protein
MPDQMETLRDFYPGVQGILGCTGREDQDTCEHQPAADKGFKTRGHEPSSIFLSSNLFASFILYRRSFPMSRQNHHKGRRGYETISMDFFHPFMQESDNTRMEPKEKRHAAKKR